MKNVAKKLTSVSVCAILPTEVASNEKETTMPLKALFQDIAAALPEDPAPIIDGFGKKHPRIMFGSRKLVFDKRKNRVFYGEILGLTMYGSFHPTQKKEMLRFLRQPNSPPPALVREVIKVVAALAKQGRDVSVSWSDGSAKPILQSDGKKVSLGKHGHVGRYEGKRFVPMKVSEIVRCLSLH